MQLTTLPNEAYRMTDSEVLERYMYGNKCRLTLVSPSLVAHTYEFSLPNNKSEFPEDVRFVYSIHTTPEKTVQKYYLGMMENGQFRLTKHSRFLEDSDVVKGAKYIVKLATNQTFFNNTPMKLYHNGRCARCGKLLDSARSIKDGYGKKCLKMQIIHRMEHRVEGLKEYSQQISLKDVFEYH